MSRNKFAAAIREAYPVPAHIEACASACRYDLMHGPSFSAIPAEGIEAFTEDHFATFADDLAEIGATIEETYSGKVGDALRAYLDDLPSDLWVDTDCDCVMTSEPEGEEDEESGEWIEPCLDSVWHVGRREIVESLFGKTIAREFS